MSTISDPKKCPKCGAPIPPEAPQGLCPKCLLAQASIPTEAGKGEASRPVPPAREALARAFPQLEILELIGQGGMGFVFKARQSRLGRLVALKILPQSSAADPAFADRFTREGRILARLNHPNIVTIHDFGQANGFFYLLMEFVDGVNLRQAMGAGRFTPEQALSVVPKICEALQFAHNEGILHRDIKPENILLDSKGRIKIADFGIAKLLGEAHSDANLTGSGGTLGTPHYMAPEQIERPAAVDHRADIYSLGVVFYEMLTGELPLGKFQPPSQKVQVDVRLDEVVLHALEKEPARRYQQVSEIKTAVDTITSAASPTVHTGPPSSTASPIAKEKPDRFWRRFAIGVVLVILAMILLLVTAIILPMVVSAISRAREQQAQVARAEVAAMKAAQLLRSEIQLLGMVTDSETEKPIPGARVVEALFRQHFTGETLQETNTDSAGRFELRTRVTEDHLITVSADGYENNSVGLVPGRFKPDGKELLEIRLQPAKSEASLPAEGRLVISPAEFTDASREPGRMVWGFKCFVPRNRLASILFVRWSNGVPAIESAFSAYFKVGRSGGIDVPFCSVSCDPISQSTLAQMTNVENRLMLAKWGIPGPAGATNVVQWNVNSGLGFTSSRWMATPSHHRKETALPRSVEMNQQLSFPLVEFDTPAVGSSNGWSGIELRFLLEPLRLPPVRMLPNEKDMTNFVGGTGLAWKMEEALNRIANRPMAP